MASQRARQRPGDRACRRRGWNSIRVYLPKADGNAVVFTGVHRRKFLESLPEGGRNLLWFLLIAFLGGGAKAILHRKPTTRWIDVFAQALATLRTPTLTLSKMSSKATRRRAPSGPTMMQLAVA